MHARTHAPRLVVAAARGVQRVAQVQAAGGRVAAVGQLAGDRLEPPAVLRLVHLLAGQEEDEHPTLALGDALACAARDPVPVLS